MMKLVRSMLSHSLVFEWQQRLCNNYGAIRDHFSEYLKVSGKDILDIGCSTGICAATAVSMADNRYIGIDSEPQYIERARMRQLPGRFEVMDARDLSFPDDSFDVILFIGALHHMEDELIHSCLRQARRVLRSEGVILCAEPVFTPGKWLSTFLLHHDRGRYIRDEVGYRRLFEGYRVLRQSYFRFSAHRFCSFVLRRLTESSSRFHPDASVIDPAA